MIHFLLELSELVTGNFVVLFYTANSAWSLPSSMLIVGPYLCSHLDFVNINSGSLVTYYNF